MGEDPWLERREIFYGRVLAYLEERTRLDEARKTWSPEFRAKVEEYERFVEKRVRDAETQGRRNALFQILRVRFGAVPAPLRQRIIAADDEALCTMIDQAITARSADEL